MLGDGGGGGFNKRENCVYTRVVKEQSEFKSSEKFIVARSQRK